MRIAMYVSGHGFGHATRQAALMQALWTRAKPALLLRTEAPVSLFEEAGAVFEHRTGRFDVGMIQQSALAVDMPATLAAHLENFSSFDAIVSRERAYLVAFAPDVVLSDCGPAPIEAAAQLGIPSHVIGNFTWDWILEDFAQSDPRWAPIVRRYAQAYSAADSYWRLPLHGKDGASFSTVRDFPHLVRQQQLNTFQVLEALGLSPDEKRRIVMVAFGGFETDEFTGAGTDELKEYLFVGFTPAPPGFKASWIQLRKQTPIRTVDLLGICSVLIGKLGYGTVAECLVYGVRMLYVPRPGIREIPCIENSVRQSGGFGRLSAYDFFSGRWKTGLDRIMEKAPPATAPADGANQLADVLLAKAPAG